MNIAFIGNFREESVNGVINSANNLAKGLKSFGVNVFFYGIGEKEETKISNGYTYRKFAKSKLPIMTPKNLNNFLKTNLDNIDIFHFHSVFIPYFIPFKNCIISLGYPYVHTPHGGYDSNLIQKNKTLKSLYIALFEQNLVKNASKVICVHEKEIPQVLNISANANTAVIYNSVEINTETNNIANIETSSKELVYLGRFDILHKGLDKLILLAKKLEELDNQITIKIYGSGNGKNQLENLISKSSVNNIKIESPVFGIEKAKVLAKATAYIQLSKWEIFGMSIVEAMLKGKTLILSSGCALSDLLTASNTGLVINTDNIETSAHQVIEYLNNIDKIKNDGIKLKSIAESKFSIDTISKQTFELYQEVLTSN